MNNYIIPTTQVCVQPPPNCLVVTVAGACTSCAPGYSLNLNNNLCTQNALPTGCLMAEALNASNCILCKAGSTEDTQYILNAATKQCSLDSCPLGQRRKLLPYTPVLLTHPSWL